MNNILPTPPKQGASENQWQQWYESLWKKVSASIGTSGDAAATISSGTTYHGVTALTAGRILTLPAASALQDGDVIIVQDETGDAAAHNITIATAGTDTVNGAASVSLTTNYGRKTIVKRGAGKFFAS
jgi:alcohol dehydrogenase YqhD (iron-dependent ADH family)